MTSTGMFLSFAYVRYSWMIIGLSSVAARFALESETPRDDEDKSRTQDPPAGEPTQ